MKHKIKYLIFTLLLCSCEEGQHVSESFSEIDGFYVKKEQVQKTMTRSSGNKETFVSGDKIYLYGYAKLHVDSTATRFMPDAAGTTGIAYQYDRDQDGWHRFQRISTSSDPEMGFWRTGQYHDFTAYHMDPQPASSNLILEMNETGLPPKEILWGEVKNIFFSGEVHVIPKITFKHQLSRIRVEVMHDMEEITSENFEITRIEFDLDKKGATFDLEKGLWKDIIPETNGHHIVEAFSPALVMTDEKFPKLVLTEVADWWVLPNCTLSDFKFSITQSSVNKEFIIDFENLFNGNDNGEPTTIVTKPGYITVLRVQFGEIKQIIFTVSLIPWDVQSEESSITDEELD